MKRTLVKVILGYLTISFSVFFLYKYQMDSSNETIAVWNETEHVPAEQVEATKMPTQTVAPKMTQEPVQTVTPKMTQEPVQTVTPEVPVPTDMPTMTEAPVLTTPPEITKKIEELSTEKVTVKYNGEEIGYCNTSYRMDEETLGKIVSMVCEEPYVNSFMLYDINSGAAISYNEEQYYPVASTIKAPFAMTCLWQIEEGLHSLEDTMVYIEEKEESEEAAEETEENSKTYTIKELIENAVAISDNVGYFLLQDCFGYEYYNQFLRDLGNRVTIGSGIKWGQTSALDSLRNWEEIYDYISSERENARFFADLLKSTNKGYIRNALGKEYEIYNKMGWVQNQCCHDHAIVMDEAPYILIIMTLGDVGKDNQKFMEDLAVVLNEVHEEMVGKIDLSE